MRLRSISRVTPILGDPLFQAFARSLADQDLSPVTVRDYLHDLKRFRTGRRGLTLPRHFAASDPLNALSQIVARSPSSALYAPNLTRGRAADHPINWACAFRHGSSFPVSPLFVRHTNC